MRYSTPLFGLIGAAAGLAVATTGYQLAAAPAVPVVDSSPIAAVGKPLPAAPALVRTRWAPCESPARLHRGACVTHVWRTTVVYDVPALPAPAPNPTLQGAAGPVRPAATRHVARHVDRGDDDASEAGEDHDDDHGDEPEVDD